MVDASNQLYEQALNGLREPVLIIDKQHNCIFGNRAFRSLVGLNDTESIDLRKIWPEVKTARLGDGDLAAEFSHQQDGETFRVKIDLARLDQGRHLLRIVARSSGGDPGQFYHAQRLETLGILAGGVAHDFNNILAGVLGHISYLKNILPASGDHIESLSAIEEGGKKASLLTQQILNFSRLDPNEKPTRTDLCEVARKTCILLRGAISPQFTINRRIPVEPIVILGSEGRLAQILVNLVINSRDALRPNGTMSVLVDRVTDRDELSKVFSGGDLSSTSFALLQVDDDGSGMSPEVLARIFEPYFSTKQNRGTGLGLSTVRSIVQEFGGAIDVKSELGRGTSVRVYLPELVAEEKTLTARGGEVSIQRGSERILVVDDEAPVRNILKMSLEHLGYSVAVAASGPEALEVCSNQHFDLVLLDMVMPEMGGEIVFEKLQEISPGLRVLIISGFAAESAIRKVLSGGGKGFLQKPFTIEELSRTVRRCFAEKPANK